LRDPWPKPAPGRAGARPARTGLPSRKDPDTTAPRHEAPRIGLSRSAPGVPPLPRSIGILAPCRRENLGPTSRRFLSTVEDFCEGLGSGRPLEGPAVPNSRSGSPPTRSWLPARSVGPPSSGKMPQGPRGPVETDPPPAKRPGALAAHPPRGNAGCVHLKGADRALTESFQETHTAPPKGLPPRGERVSPSGHWSLVP